MIAHSEHIRSFSILAAKHVQPVALHRTHPSAVLMFDLMAVSPCVAAPGRPAVPAEVAGQRKGAASRLAESGLLATGGAGRRRPLPPDGQGQDHGRPAAGIHQVSGYPAGSCEVAGVWEMFESRVADKLACVIFQCYFKETLMPVEDKLEYELSSLSSCCLATARNVA